MNKYSCAFAALALSFLAVSASAAPLVWTLQGVTFTDGGTASGSFMYDAATNTYSNVNITTTAGSVRTGATYHFVAGPPNSPDSNFFLQLTIGSGILTGTPAFSLVFPSAGLTASGGTVAVTFGLEALCSDAVCTGPSGPSRTVTGRASVVASTPNTPAPVPALSTWGLGALGMLLAGVGWFFVRGSASA